MAAKPKSFMKNRAAEPSSASDEDFELVVGAISPDAAHRPIYSQNILVGRIKPNPFQARESFEGLEELAEVIKLQGFTSRLRVRPDPLEEGFFQLVYGERRLRAAKLAQLNEVPCDVALHTDKELVEIGLAENIQRQDLKPVEEAKAFQKFIEYGNYTIRELAERIGKNKDYVDGRLALLRAPQDVQELVNTRPDAVTAARRIATLEDAHERKPLIEGVLQGTLTKEEVRQVIQNKRVRPDGQISKTPLVVRPDGQNTTFIEKDKANFLATISAWEAKALDLPLEEKAQMLKAVWEMQDLLRKLEERLQPN